MNTTAHRTGSPVCGREPGKEPLAEVDRAVLIAVHLEPTGPTAIRALPQRHGLPVPTPATGLARLAFIEDYQDFPSQDAFVGKHLHEAREPPIVIDRPMEGFLMLGMLLGDHLPLLKISDHHSPFNQFVSDEMRGFLQTVTTLVALLFRNPLMHLGEVDIPAGLLFAAVPLGADLVQLLGTYHGWPFSPPM